MKRVVIVRHAKSVPYGYDDDFNRDLKNRGFTDAEKISLELNSMDIKPDVIISSPAKRAFKTATIFSKNLGFDTKKIQKVEEIYDGLTTSEFIDLIHNLPESANTAFFFGHNPGFYNYVTNLLSYFNNDMPTCSTVGIDFPVDSWKNVGARSGIKAFQLIPRMFK